MKSNRGIVDSIFRHYPSSYLNHTSFVALKKLIYMQSDKLLFLNSSDFFFKLIINSWIKIYNSNVKGILIRARFHFLIPSPYGNGSIPFTLKTTLETSRYVRCVIFYTMCLLRCQAYARLKVLWPMNFSNIIFPSILLHLFFFKYFNKRNWKQSLPIFLFHNNTGSV